MAQKITDMVKKPVEKKATTNKPAAKPAAKKPATKKITKEAEAPPPIEDVEIVTPEPENEVTEAPGSKKPLPKRKPQMILQPAWFQKTVTLALKYKSTLMFTGDKVWGICQNSGNSCFVMFESNAEWCQAIAALFPKGAVFGCADGSVVGGDVFKKMRAYSKVALDEESSAYIDTTTGIVHVIGKGIHLKSCTFSKLEMAAPEHPKEAIVPFVYTDSIPAGMHNLMISAVSKDETRKNIVRSSVYTEDKGRTILAGTNGNQIVALPITDPPDNFSFNPHTINANDITGFVCCKNEHEVMTNYYSMSDGVLFTEVIGAYFYLEKSPVGEFISRIRGGANNGSVDGDFLKSTVESIDSLGLNTGVLQNFVVFRDKKIVFKTEEGEVADYDGEVAVEGTPTEVVINFSALREFARFGCPLGLNPGGPCFAETDSLIFVVMSMKMV